MRLARGRGTGGGVAGPIRPGSDVERPISPSEVNSLARELLETAFPGVWVAGEVTGWKRHASGHCYFALRDARAQIRCVMFAQDARRLPTDPAEGMEVRAFGAITLYERRGEYQLRASVVEGAGGDGLWRLAFDRLRAALDGEGLLAPARKRRLPSHPVTVGVVTSRDGAALQDILRVIGERAPWTRVLLAPARVQGDGAAGEIAAALARLALTGRADVIVVGRGGGSIEDLWAFNDEVVARAIVAAAVPVVSAVGHEVDVTIADLVADARAPTPSAAAELVTPDRRALQREIASLEARLRAGLRNGTARNARLIERLDEAVGSAARRRLRSGEERALRAAGKLEALSPLASMRRGYAVPLDREGRILRGANSFHPGDPFRLRVVDGSIGCTVREIEVGVHHRDVEDA